MTRRSRMVATWFALAVVCISFGGCYFFRRDEIKPSNSFRNEASGMKGTGLDSRARQIESNLGVR